MHFIGKQKNITNEDAQKENKSEQVLYTKNEDLEWALVLNRLALRVIGVWPGDKEKQGFRRLTVLLRVPLMITVLFFYILIPQILALMKVMGDMPLVLDNLIESSPTIVHCMKMYFMWRSKQVLRPVIQSFAEDWLRPKLTWEQETMIREASRARTLAFAGYTLMAGCLIGFGIGPFFGFSIRILSNIIDYGSRHLILQTYYPYDYSKSPNYEITCTIQFFCCCVLTFYATIPLCSLWHSVLSARHFHCEALKYITKSTIANSKWYIASRQSKQEVILIMLAAKNPQTLTAGKFFTLSLATYCNIIKSTAGYISMLFAVNKRL